MSLLDRNSHIHQVMGHIFGQNQIDPALIGAEAVTAGVAAEVGSKDEASILDRYLLAFVNHKYQSPFYRTSKFCAASSCTSSHGIS